MADESTNANEQPVAADAVTPTSQAPQEPVAPVRVIPKDVIINPAAGGFDGDAVLMEEKKERKPTTAVNEAEEIGENDEVGENQGGEVVLNRITTYQDAIKEALRSQSMSSASLLMAEERRRKSAAQVEENESIKTPKNRWLLVGAAALIIIGLLVLGFAFLSRDDNILTNGPRNVITDKFFEPNGVVNIASAQLSRNTILKLQQVLSGPMARNTIQQIVITKEQKADPNSAYNITTAVPYTADELLALVQARVDTAFNRSIDQDFFLGVHLTANNETFLLFRVTNFDNVFAAMFAWENTMARDLEAIFPNALGPVNKPQAAAIPKQTITFATTTATSSATTTTAAEPVPQIPQRTTAGLFSDQVIANSDARVIKDAAGNVIFFYTFIDEEYVYFGTKAQALNEVKKRIRSSKLVI